MKNSSKLLTLEQALSALLPVYRKVLLFGMFTSLLALAPSWYMLEVYDRVVASRNVSTLLMLTLMVVFSYCILEGVEWVRRQLLHGAAIALEQAIRPRVYEVAFAEKLKQPDFPVEQVFSDFRILKQALYSPAVLGLLDLPFAGIFLGFVFYIHPTMGVLTLSGLLVLSVVTFMNQFRSAGLLKTANVHAVEAQRYFQSVSSKAEVVCAMGMLAPVEQRWMLAQQQFLQMQAQASDSAAVNTAASRLIQTLLGSLILGLGCHLALAGEIASGGALMVVASILAARALSPLIQLVMQWKTLAQGREAFVRLSALMVRVGAPISGMSLPPPTGEISVENLGYGQSSQHAPLSSALFLRGVQFRLQPGEVLVVAGPSASGKTTLSRLIAGALLPVTGKVRFDGVDVTTWNKAELGPFIGYMPQHVGLLDGTVAENIVRFGEMDQQKLAEVVDLLGLDELVDSLPQGLDTLIGMDGVRLSGGQRQLVGLARAAYGVPRIMILDEPNANLDPQGEKCFQQMVIKRKRSGTTFVIVSHLQSTVALADQMMVLAQGQVCKFGKPADVLAAFHGAAGKAGQA